MQRPGIGAIRTHIPTSKPKWEITQTTISQNTKKTYGQPIEQLFPKRWPLSHPNRTKNNMNKQNLGKRHRNSDTKTDNREPQQNCRLGTACNRKTINKIRLSPQKQILVSNSIQYS